MITKKRAKHQIISDINVVPYIDVMLVLLIVFMLATPILEKGVEVDLPSTSKAQVLDFNEVEPIIVTIDAQGNFYVSIGDKDKPLQANALIARVYAALSLNPNSPVMVRGDENVPYGEVIKVMNYLEKAGVEKVGFITETL